MLMLAYTFVTKLQTRMEHRGHSEDMVSMLRRPQKCHQYAVNVTSRLHNLHYILLQLFTGNYTYTLSNVAPKNADYRITIQAYFFTSSSVGPAGSSEAARLH